jgi:hypothetical protein
MVSCNPEDVFKAWLNSPGHHFNMINSGSKYGAVGMGLKLDEIHLGKFSITYNTSRGFTTFMGRR